jgi:D-glycero-alpha-D-manno-heptose-7-phosphate kinase
VRIRAKAPLRVTFAGGGTDVPPYPEQEGGAVLNATIDSYAWGTLRPRDDDGVTISSVDLDLTVSYKVGAPAPFDGQLDLAKASLRRVVGSGSQGFDILLHSDAPPGSGLGSSSALVVALVGLVNDWKGLALTDYELAGLACDIERRDLSILGGMQDQYAASFGGFNYMEFTKDRVVVNPLRVGTSVVNELEHNLLLCFTGTTRRSDAIIEDQMGRYSSADAVTVAALHKQKELALEMKNSLLQGRLHDFGELLDVSWLWKKRMSDRISNPTIDTMYEEAKRCGAIGGKILGAGGGGYMMLYCEFERKHIVADSVRRLGGIPTKFAFEKRGMQTWRSKE